MVKHAAVCRWCGRASLHSVIAVFIFLVQETHSKEVIRGKLLSVASSESSSADDLPASMGLDVRLDDQLVHLDLVRDSKVKQVPVYVLSTDKEGKEQVRRAPMKEKEYAMYYDQNHYSAFGVFRTKDGNGTMRYRLEGVVHSGGKIYDLKSTGNSLTSRHRRDVRSNETNNNSTDVKDGDSENAYQGEEAEFELNVYSDRAADQSDSLPRPPSGSPRKKVMGSISSPVMVEKAPPPLLSSTLLPKVRMRRQATQDVFIDVVALADYGVYKSWYDRSTANTAAKKQEEALDEIRRYYAFVMNGVNMLYRTITSLPYSINVRLSGILISTMASSSSWSEQYRQSSLQRDQVDANQVLKAVSRWAATTDVLPAYDHLMVFSGYDLTKTSNGVTSKDITGLAYTATLCSVYGEAVSLVEDLGGFQCIGTAAHELGHGLSAEHDGIENSCQAEDRYIMAAGSYRVTASNKLNPWKFSPCSINYFNSFITSELRTARGRQCLYQSSTESSNIPNVTSLMEGQLYDADEQCRHVYGPESRLCRGPEFGEAADICTDMFCYDPSTSATCFQFVAARGTTCGNRKWCESGRCVSNSAAPAVADNCVFGDQPGLTFDNKSCASFVDSFPGYCYQPVVQARCCASCARHLRLLTGCLYGDKGSGCQRAACSVAPPSYLQSCCGTCNYGTPFTTTTTSTRATSSRVIVTTRSSVTTKGTSTSTTSSSTSTTTTRNRPIAITTITPVATTTTSTSTKTINTRTRPIAITTTIRTKPSATTASRINTTSSTRRFETCVDNSSVTIDNMDCETVTIERPELCYEAEVIRHCCASCMRVASEEPGCEYGDRYPINCSSVSVEWNACSSLQPVCCKTCAGYRAPSGAASVTVTSFHLLLCLISAALFWAWSIF